MEQFEITVNEDGGRATYDHPQLIGVEITENEVELQFDPMHSDTVSLTYPRSDLVNLDVLV